MTLSEMALVVTMLVAISGALLGWDARRTARERLAEARKTSAEGDSAAAKAVEILLEPLNERITKLSDDLMAANIKIATLTVQVQERDGRIAEQQNELDEFRAGFTILTAQMREAKIEPRWQPRPKPGTGPLTSKK